MRWLITTDGPNAHHYHRMGVARALKHAGHEVSFLDIRHQSPYDAFDVLDPEILWTQSYNLNTPLKECIKTSNCKVFMRAFDFGPMLKTVEKLNRNGADLMIEAARSSEIENVKEIAGRVSFVCNHYVPSMIGEAMEYWKQWVPVTHNMLGYCPFTYGGGKNDPLFTSDVSFIGSYHHRKPALNNYIIQLNELKYKRPLNIKVFSTWHWPSEYYCGVVPTERNKDVYHNAAICPNISEEHSRQIGHDVIERIYSVLGGGNFCISDYVKGAEELFEEEMVFAKSKDEFQKLILHYLDHPEERYFYCERAKKKVWAAHTYFDRAHHLFYELGFYKEAENMLRVKEEYASNSI